MKVTQNLWVILTVIVVAIVTRLIPHWPNFTALGAAALFGGAYVHRKYAFLIPVTALFVSDLLLNNLVYARQFPHNYDGFILLAPQALWSYGAFILIVFLGFTLIKRVKLLTVIGTSIGASLIFFLITNFAVWLGSSLYDNSIPGLIMAFVAGLPFFWNTLAGDLFFAGVFFGGYELVKVYMRRNSTASSSRVPLH